MGTEYLSQTPGSSIQLQALLRAPEAGWEMERFPPSLWTLRASPDCGESCAEQRTGMEGFLLLREGGVPLPPPPPPPTPLPVHPPVAFADPAEKIYPAVNWGSGERAVSAVPGLLLSRGDGNPQCLHQVTP